MILPSSIVYFIANISMKIILVNRKVKNHILGGLSDYTDMVNLIKQEKCMKLKRKYSFILVVQFICLIIFLLAIVLGIAFQDQK